MLVAFDAADHEEDHSDQTSKEEENVEYQRGVNAGPNTPMPAESFVLRAEKLEDMPQETPTIPPTRLITRTAIPL